MRSMTRRKRRKETSYVEKFIGNHRLYDWREWMVSLVKVTDFLFDDDTWLVRWLVIDTGRGVCCCVWCVCGCGGGGVLAPGPVSALRPPCSVCVC